MDSLEQLRKQLDQIDTQIVSLLDQRMGIVDRIGIIKRDLHQNITDKARENVVLKHVESESQNFFLKENIRHIYKAIIETSKIEENFYHYKFCPFSRIGIIGTCLIGGSICKEIKIKDPSIEILSVFQETEDNSLAQRAGLIDKQYGWEEFIQCADLIILASPISTIIPFAEKIKQARKGSQKLIVIDIASVKSEIVGAFERLSDGQLEFVGTHPIVDNETKGFANSQATLLVNKPWIIVPHTKNDESTIHSIQEFIHFLGAKPLFLEKEEHDRQAALISHIPCSIAKSYVDFIYSVNEGCLEIAGTEFNFLTQIALNPVICEETAEYNKLNIKKYLQQWLERSKLVN